MSTLFQHACRVTVSGLAVEGLRVGFTIDKDTTRRPNTAEVVIYNLARGTREKLHAQEGIPVVVEAGYEMAGLTVWFVGEMREAFSTSQADGTWMTVLRAGDGDKALRKARQPHALLPGVSFERAISDLAKDMGVGIGNVGKELAKQLTAGTVSAEGLGTALSKGFAGSGSTASQLDVLLRSLNQEWSVQDQELQVLPRGKLYSTAAVRLTNRTGLEGTPSIDAKGVMQCTARLVPGLLPGHPVIVESEVLKTTGEGLWRIEKVHVVGDTHGRDWHARLTCMEIFPNE